MLTAYLYVFAILFGLCVGSYLNVVIYRVPRGMSTVGNDQPSHCPQCGYQLKWYDNIPVLSYIMLKGRCRSCHQHITFRYTVVELLNTALWVLCAVLFYNEAEPVTAIYAVLAMIACSLGVCVFFIDKEHTIIPDRFHLFFLTVGLGMLLYDLFSGVPVLTWQSRLIGAGVGLGLFLLIYFGALLVLKREGMGQGDVKFAGAVGFVLGWKALLLMVLIASVVACIVLVTVKLVAKDGDETEYPFAPFLVLGFWIALYFGEAIVNWYVALL